MQNDGKKILGIRLYRGQEKKWKTADSGGGDGRILTKTTALFIGMKIGRLNTTKRRSLSIGRN